MRAHFAFAGQSVMCIDSPVKHEFDFTPSFSFFVECESEEEIDRLVAALGEDGALLMPPDDYGFSRKFAWLNDRFGVSWQLNLA
jgi:predicted 3-demethylubiquinone-9 3-methyltransferase (glyoxalase superfamily)